jgi:hypothetical protein
MLARNKNTSIIAINNRNKSFETATPESMSNAFSLIIEGTTEKVTQFIMQLKSLYKLNFSFI